MRRCTTLCNSRPESVCMPDTFPATPHLTAAFVFPGRRQSRSTMHSLSAHPSWSLARLRKIVDTRPPTATTGNALTMSVTRGITEHFRLRSRRLAGSPTRARQEAFPTAKRERSVCILAGKVETNFYDSTHALLRNTDYCFLPGGLRIDGRSLRPRPGVQGTRCCHSNAGQ